MWTRSGLLHADVPFPVSLHPFLHLIRLQVRFINNLKLFFPAGKAFMNLTYDPVQFLREYGTPFYDPFRISGKLHIPDIQRPGKLRLKGHVL